MRNPWPPHRLTWIAVAAFGIVVLLPGTRTLLRGQWQMETRTYATEIDLTAERTAAARLPNDYPVQLALAAGTTHSDGVPGELKLVGAVPTAQTHARNRRIEALTHRFPNRPSVYANLLRYMTMEEVHIGRNDDGNVWVDTAEHPTYPTSPAALEMFATAARKGAALDPDNAYFPMMQAIGLLAAQRDREAWNALKAAGRCSRWTEYYQDDEEGRYRLQSAAYGERGAIRRLAIAPDVLFPQYAQIRTAARLSVHRTADAERVGNREEALAVRHAMMRCGGLMRARGTSYCTVLEGIAIADILTTHPGGVEKDHFSFTGLDTVQEKARRRERRLQRYYTYLESFDHPQEAAWAKAEIAAGDQAKAIVSEVAGNSAFEGNSFFRLGRFRLVNLVLLSSVLVLMVLGAVAHLAGSVCPKRAVWAWRFACALVTIGGIGLWQWQAAGIGVTPYIDILNAFCPGNADAPALQWLIAGLSLLVPVLFVGTLAAITLLQRVPLATGLGRGLRGAAIPTAACLFLLYGASLLPTACAETVSMTEISSAFRNEPRYYARYSHKVWPGDPQP